MRVGIISDTHGLLRPEAVKALTGVDKIIHAGDVGTPEVLDSLTEIAPVMVVRGNVDRGEWGDSLPISATFTLEGIKIHLLHIRQELSIDPKKDQIQLVIFGHSHKPFFEESEGVLYLNPGAAGKRRFSLPITLAILEIENGKISIHLHNLLTGEITQLA